jgi:L-lactate dehydrogenase complex protein LldE
MLPFAPAERMKITVFIPCFVDTCFPSAAMSVVRVLERLGHTVDFPAELGCCGQPAFNSGYWHEAKPVAQRAIRRLESADAVVVPSGSCGAMIKNFYPQLFAGTSLAESANVLSARTFEFSDFLVNQLHVTDVGARFPQKVTFHDGCHGLRELGTREQPRLLLRAVRELQLIEMVEAETCCGFGGTFGVKFPMISTAMGEVKCASAAETGADVIVSNDSSCLMQIQGLLSRQKQRQGKPLRTMHLAEVLAAE